MTRKLLTGKFFNRKTEQVARELLGKFLVRRAGGKNIALMITETEAYDGFKDRGSHASRGKTFRNQVMFGPAGRWYVYFTYGMHWMLNIVTREEKYPAAVLIRGAWCAPGPAKLTKLLKVDDKLNSHPARKSSGLWIEDWGVEIRSKEIGKGSRVGIAYAGTYWSRRRWRFWLKY